MNQEQGQAPPLNKGEGIIKMKDGLSRCESPHDLYAYIRRPNIHRERTPLNPIPEPISVHLKRDARQKMIQGTWSGESFFLLMIGRIAHIVFLTIGYPCIFICYMIPKWIIMAIVTLIILFQKGIVASLLRVRVFGDKITSIVGPFFKGIRLKWIALYRYIATFFYWIKLRFFGIKKFYSLGIGSIQKGIKWTVRQVDRILFGVGRGFAKFLGFPKQAWKKIVIGLKVVNEWRLRFRQWLLKAPFIFLSWLSDKVDQFDRYKEKQLGKVRWLGRALGNKLDQLILGSIASFQSIIQLIIRFLWMRQFFSHFRSSTLWGQDLVAKGINFLANNGSHYKQILSSKLLKINALMKLQKKWVKGKGKLSLPLRTIHNKTQLCSNLLRVKVKQCYGKFNRSLDSLHLPKSEYLSRMSGLNVMRFVGTKTTRLKIGLSKMERFGNRLSHGFSLTCVWGVVCWEYTLEQTQSIAMEMDKKLPLVALLSQFH